MPVSGVVIRCQREKAEALSRELARPESVEIHGVLSDGSIIAVIEAESVDGEMEIVTGILNTAGVIDVRLAYHDFSDLQHYATDGDNPVKGDC